jgi:hypothetical protein
MTDPRIQTCIYEGTHNPITDGFRHRVRVPMSGEPPSNDPPVAVPVPYALIYRCKACNMEERRFFNVPERARAADNTEGVGAVDTSKPIS